MGFNNANKLRDFSKIVSFLMVLVIYCGISVSEQDYIFKGED